MRVAVVAMLGMLSVVASCGESGTAVPDAVVGVDAPDAPPPDASLCGATNLAAPTRLADTGLCIDAACAAACPGVEVFAPQYALYTDGAMKRRWIALPGGTTIDTADMNYWKFPVGTRVWKEFVRDGVRVETRYMTKMLDDDTQPGSWTFLTFQWNGSNDDATLVDAAGVMDANGTGHDIPSRGQCRTCHDRLRSRVLGFGAMSLDYDAPAPSLDLAELTSRGLLSQPPGVDTTGTVFPIPGTAIDHAAFGYLHANCGTCHNPTSPVHDITPLDLRLDVTKLASKTTIPARATTVDVNGTVGGPAYAGKIVDPGNPDTSVMILRINATTLPAKMPQLGTEIVDPQGLATLRTWISQPP